MKSSFKTYDLGDGWYLTAEKVSSWTEYAAAKLDRPGGYVVDGLSKRGFCRRQDAEKWIAEQRA